MKNLNLKVKIIIMAVIIITAFTLVTSLYIVPTMNNSIDAQVEQKLRELVEVPYATIEGYYAQFQSGTMDEADALEASLRSIEMLRYQEGSNYYFILDYDVNMVMHPIKPELNGKNLAESTDEAGNPLFQEMIDVVRTNDEGVVNYVWEKAGETEVQPKSSFVVGFKPWNLILGTGIYVDDVEAIKAEVNRNVFIITTVIVLFALIFVVVIILDVNKSVKKIMFVSNKIGRASCRERVYAPV